MSKLKPCPFCGSDNIEVVREGTRKVSTIIECGNCGCKLESGDQGKKFDNSWNTREDIKYPSNLNIKNYIDLEWIGQPDMADLQENLNKICE